VLAIVKPGYRARFASWSGDVQSTSNPITITMNRDYTLQANFTDVGPLPLPDRGRLTISVSGTGSPYSIYINKSLMGKDSYSALLVAGTCRVTIYNREGTIVKDETVTVTANQDTVVKVVDGDTPGHTLQSDSVYTNPVEYQVTRTLTIANTDARIDLARVWLPSVVAWDSQTNITPIVTTPNPNNVSKDSQYGNSVLYWEFRNGPAKGSSAVIKDEFTYTCYQINYKVDTGKVGTYDKTSGDYQHFTRPEKYVESDDARLTAIARQLQQGKTNPYDTAGAIYDWVIDNMAYRKVDGLKGAKFSLENRYGECGDYSALFTALCRAAGIPARTVVGRWATSSPDDWHVWAEFYLPGYGWLPVDPTDADLNKKGRACFGNLDNKRLILHKGFSIVLQPGPVSFKPEVGFLQLYCWEYQGAKGQAPIQTEISYTIGPRPPTTTK